MKMHKNILPGAIVAMFFLACVVRFPTQHMRLSFRLVMEYGIITAAGLYIIFRVNPWIGLFLIWSIVSANFPFFNKYSYMSLNAVVLGCLWLILVHSTATAQMVRWFLNAMCAVALISCFMAALQYADLDPLFRTIGGGRDIPVGIMSNPNIGGALIAFCIAAFFRKTWCRLIPVAAVGLFMIGSMGAIISAISAGAVFWYAKS